MSGFPDYQIILLVALLLSHQENFENTKVLNSQNAFFPLL